MQRISLVVAGVPVLARALEATGKFQKVHAVESTSGLKDLIQGGILKGSKDELVFLFGDTLHVDTPQTPLPLLLQKLTTSGWKVVLVALSPRAKDLVAAYPAAGLLEGAVSVNMTIGAIAGMGVPGLDPADDGFDILDLNGGGPVARPATGGWAPAPSTPEPAPWGAPQAPAAQERPRGLRRPEEPKQKAPEAPAAGGGWAQAPAPTPPASPAGGGWASAPAPEAPAAGGGWASAPTPEAPAAGGGWASAPAPTPPASPAGGGWASAPTPEAPAAGGWGAPASSPPPTNDWPAPTGAPVVPAETGGGRRLAPPSPGAIPGQGPDPAAGWQAGPQAGAGAPGALPPFGDEMGGPVARGGYGAQHALPQRRGWVITVTAPKGGTGKSSLTLNLATYLGLRLRQSGKTVCVIDANFQQADTGKYLNVYNPNITNIVRDQTALSRERLGSYLVHRAELNISALLGPATPMDASPVYINARLYCQVLDVLRELYDYILIDTPVAEKYHDIFSGFALPQADFIIVPVAPNVATLMNADAWLRAVTAPRHTGGDGVEEAKIGVVLNRAKANIDCSEEEVRQELASWNFIGSIPETDEWQRCNNNNELVATKNYSELNEAFARVLYAATGEQTLLENLTAPVSDQGGIGTKLKKIFGRG